MTIKIVFLFFGSLFLASQVVAETEKKTSKARAYRAHLMTFLWPEGSSNEKIHYDNVVDLSGLLHFSQPPKNIESNDGFSFGIGIGKPRTNNPFDEYKKQLDKEVTVLSNQTWPMIFEQRTSVVKQSFYSDNFLNGYPVLLGDIKVTLGRYLETEVNYKHYAFDSFSVPALFSIGDQQSHRDLSYATIPILSNAAMSFERKNGNIVNTPTIKLYQPNSLLEIKLDRKTASKKLNYLDHPIIGSLLYFEPIKVEEAEQEIMLKEIESELNSELMNEL